MAESATPVAPVDLAQSSGVQHVALNLPPMPDGQVATVALASTDLPGEGPRLAELLDAMVCRVVQQWAAETPDESMEDESRAAAEDQEEDVVMSSETHPRLHTPSTSHSLLPSDAVACSHMKATVNVLHVKSLEDILALPPGADLLMEYAYSKNATDEIPGLGSRKDLLDAYAKQFDLWTDHLKSYAPAGLSICDRFNVDFLNAVLLFNSKEFLQDLALTSLRPKAAVVFHELGRLASLSEEFVEFLWAHRDRDAFPNVNSSMLASEIGLGFLARDAGSAKEEEQGILRFQCITNDRRPDSLISLVTLKNIFSRQLPKMPREYIVRLVFDTNHYSFCLLKSGRVIGGVCYRPFFERRFAEIAFLAIMSAEQVKGYGTRLMNHLKEHVKAAGIEYFLTYADNFAVGYFRKQGFSDHIAMPKERWQGCIKDYDGGTLMECYISPNINYLNLGQMLKMQKNAVRLAMNKYILCRSRLAAGMLPEEAAGGIEDDMIEGYIPFKVYEGLQFPDDDEATDEDRLKRLENLQAFKDIKWTYAEEQQYRQQMEARSRKEKSVPLWEQLLAVVEIMSKHESAWPFRKPVTPDEAPDYHEVIKHPMDIQTMRRKAKDKSYSCVEDFTADVMLMFDNCRFYNREDTIYFKYANQLQKYIMPKIEAIDDTCSPIIAPPILSSPPAVLSRYNELSELVGRT